jgi:MYXO-CTERM domain-containing protein
VSHTARIVIVGLVGLVAPTPARAQFCPSYSSTSATNPNSCGVPSAQGTDPGVAAWKGIIETACAGPEGAGWGSGPDIPTIGKGCGSGIKVAAAFPCELVEAIFMQETRWVQFCEPTQPADQVGPPARTIISRDCGYGISQVTTGMHTGETPDWDRPRVAGEPLYAAQVGLKILAEKWRATSCVGDNQPTVVEDWYIATWAYNGLAFSNNPNNPNLDAMRPVCDPNVSCAGRPYQERVWGWMEHPPADGRWSSIAPAYPDLSEIPSTSGVKIPNLSEPRCASPTSCASTRAVHTTRCVPAPAMDLGAIDGATAPDLGGEPPPDGGCGCTLGGQQPMPRALLFALVLVALARRRRHAPPRE